METNKNSVIGTLKIDVEKHRLIAAVGAGGKTTLIYRLARELQERGKRPVVTTTTHMGNEGRFGFTPIGMPCGDGKIKGISISAPRELLKEYDTVLVEADGSRCLPFKVPAEYEPVLPVGVDLVIGIAGASAVGGRFLEKCCRFELACKYLGVKPEHNIELCHLVEALNSPWGQKKNVSCDYRGVIGQADLLNKEQRKAIEGIFAISHLEK